MRCFERSKQRICFFARLSRRQKQQFTGLIFMQHCTMLATIVSIELTTEEDQQIIGKLYSGRHSICLIPNETIFGEKSYAENGLDRLTLFTEVRR